MLRIQTITLALALFAGVAVAAGAQEASAAPKSDTTTLSNSGKRHQIRGSRTDRGDRALFKGVDLTSAQRARVDSIHKKYQAEAKPLRDEMAPAMKEARAARQSGDSAKIQAARQNMSASRDKMMALRKQEMAEIRGILTPAQQATFDKNVSATQEHMREGRRPRRSGRHGGSPTS